MKFMVRVVDYHFGGHVSYVKMLSGGSYKFESQPKNATVFSSASEFAIIRDNLTKDVERQVTIEQVVDDEVLQTLKRL